MKTKKDPRELSSEEATAIVDAFDRVPDEDYSVVGADVLEELRAAAAVLRQADGRIEAALVTRATAAPYRCRCRYERETSHHDRSEVPVPDWVVGVPRPLF